jgi:peptide/nickel transport system ATP-binding protein/oligopeptide transport system ATP-binding protein
MSGPATATSAGGTQLAVSDLRVEIASNRGVVHAVDGLSLEVAPGEAVGLVGESGSGKSMTLKAILGVLPPEAKITAGQVVLDGTDLTSLSHSRLNKVRGRRIAMIFQEPMSALNPVMRVGNQIAEGPRVHLGMSRAQSVERALDLMRRVGIPDPERRFRSYPHEFSGGMRQRVMIAIALSCDPELILCDEPTTALDVTIQDQILRLLAQLCGESGTSLIFVTHDLPVVAQVFRSPRHPYTLGLLRSAPDVDHPGQSLVPIPGSPPSLVSPPSGCRFHPRCIFAEEDCTVIDPSLRVLEDGRATACLHYDRILDEMGAEA